MKNQKKWYETDKERVCYNDFFCCCIECEWDRFCELNNIFHKNHEYGS